VVNKEAFAQPERKPAWSAYCPP